MTKDEVFDRAEESVRSRKCPVCFESGTVELDRIDPRGNSYSEFTFECTCGAKFVSYVSHDGSDRRIPIHFKSDSLPGWKNCSRCYFFYGPSEFPESGPAVPSPQGEGKPCPVCGYPSSLPSGWPREKVDDSEVTGCPSCGKGELKRETFSVSHEFRDGIMGDYTRSTYHQLCGCMECGAFVLMETIESDKIGRRVDISYKFSIDERMALRIAESSGIGYELETPRY